MATTRIEFVAAAVTATLQPLEGIKPVRRPLEGAASTCATAVIIVSVSNDPETAAAAEHQAALEMRRREKAANLANGALCLPCGGRTFSVKPSHPMGYHGMG